MARSPFKRTARVASVVREVVGELLTFEVKDPRVRGAVVTDVEVTGDLRQARIFLMHPGDEDEARQMMRGLAKASGFMRRELGQRIRMRVTPSLDFRFDRSYEYAARIEARLAELGLGEGAEHDGSESEASQLDASEPDAAEPDDVGVDDDGPT